MQTPVNFVFILADDLGYADLGCYGARASVSPTLDRLAGRGTRFTQAYANSSVCSPTRFALITGRYQYRLRGAAEEPLSRRMKGNPEVGLPPSHPGWPSLLQAAGYHTVLIGKWHLGFPPHFGPLKSGYDEFFGALGGGLDYFTHRDGGGHHDLYDGEEPSSATGYLTDLISQRTVDCIDACARRRQPFALSVHYTAPHWPWETREDEAEAHRLAALKSGGTSRNLPIAHTDGGSLETYQTMIRQMDEGIATIVQALERHGLLEQTVLVFTSDNGGERYSDNWPLLGRKMDLLEGGIRVPAIVFAPGRVAAGQVSDQVNISMDWMPTLLDWAGVAAHPEYPSDGQSLRPWLEGASESQARTLYWRTKYRAQRAVRSGDWKYLSIDGREYLFDLAHDARECANLAPLAPDRLQHLRACFEQWQATMPPVPEAAISMLAYSNVDLPAG